MRTTREDKKYSTDNRQDIISSIQRILEQDGSVIEAWLFGSFARKEETDDSDIDLLVRFDETKRLSLFDFANLSWKLEQGVKRKIDLVEKESLKKIAWETAQHDLIKIYG